MQRHLSHLLFVDDILILINSSQEFEEMLENLAEACVNARLKINLEKSKMIFKSFAQKIKKKSKDCLQHHRI